MSDRSFTFGGQTFEVRRRPDGSLEVRQGKSQTIVAKPSADAVSIDYQTKRLHQQEDAGRRLFWVYAKGPKRVLSWPGGSLELEAADLTEGAGGGTGSLKPLKLTMPGKVLSVKVKEGETVEAGADLVIVEAMKMENLLTNSVRAKVAKVHVKEGDRLESGTTLISFSPAD
jgi:acetyl/propionyl-CoA carboxylase alpha subunit